MQQDKKSLWGLSWTHFCLGASSLMVFTVLPVFMRDELGMSQTKIGWVEGAAIASAFGAKVLSGVLSDVYRRRKPFIFIGSLLSLFSKPLFVLAAWMLNPLAIILARFFDRVSKGIRSSPADALTADLSPKNLRGKGFGIKQALYVAGCGAGMVAAALLLSQNYSYVSIFALAGVPSILALVALGGFTQEAQSQAKATTKSRPAWRLSEVRLLPWALWQLYFVIFILMLGRFSEAFILLRAKDIGCPVALLPVFLLPEFTVHGLVAYPAGRLADRICTKRFFMWGLWLFSAAALALAMASSPMQMILGSLILGLHISVTQIVMRKMVAESTPEHLQGTAFALFHLVQGVAILLCNPLAGALADTFSSNAPFVQSLACSLLAAFVLSTLPQNAKASFTETLSKNEPHKKPVH